MTMDWSAYLLKQTTPHRALESYLKLTGWTELRQLQDAVAYQSADGMLRKLIPTNIEYADYAKSLFYEISELTSYYHKDVDELLLDIYESAEVFRFHFESDLNAQHNIRWIELTDFASNVKDALTDSGYNVDQVQRYRKRRVNTLVENCQFGQTQAGSFVMKLFIPKVTLDTDALNQDEKRRIAEIKHRYQREISNYIYASYKELSVLNYTSSETKDEEIDSFINKNYSLCKSIASTVETNNDYLGIVPKWSAWLPQTSNMREELHFKSQEYEWLPERIDQINKKIITAPKNIIGHVLQISRDVDYDGKTKDPFIRIRYRDEYDQSKLARLEVTEEQYSQALDAAKPNSGIVIGIQARITKRPKVDLIFKEDILFFNLHSDLY